MSRTNLSLKISWHRGSGQYIKYVEKSYGSDGNLRPKAHYLGSDRTAAIRKAAELLSLWYGLLASGADAWPRDFSFERSALPLLVSYPSVTALPVATAPDIAVKEATKRFIDSIRLRCKLNLMFSFYASK